VWVEELTLGVVSELVVTWVALVVAVSLPELELFEELLPVVSLADEVVVDSLAEVDVVVSE
jgi:hypothetical protein